IAPPSPSPVLQPSAVTVRTLSTSATPVARARIVPPFTVPGASNQSRASAKRPPLISTWPTSILVTFICYLTEGCRCWTTDRRESRRLPGREADREPLRPHCSHRHPHG